MPKLTTDLLKRAMPEPGRRLELRDDDEPGLIFRVTENGRRSWSVRYRNVAGEHRRKNLGSFPAVSLSKAREEARKVKGAVAGGADLVAAERLAKADAEARRLRTIDGLAEVYFADAALGLHRANAKGPKRPGTLSEERRIYDRLVKPRFGSVPLADMKRADIQAFVTKQSRGAPSNGRHCRNIIRQLLSYAVGKDLLDHNPAHDIAVVTPSPRERVMNDAELASFWRACQKPHEVEGLALSLEMGVALRTAAATLQRGGEVIGMQWSEIDRKARAWLIPASRMKGKKPHLVPLSDLALHLLDEARDLCGEGDYVFRSARTAEGAHMDRRALSRAMKRIVTALQIPSATPHDLRRTGATLLTSERVGIPRFIVSQVIGHAGDTGGAAIVTGRHYDLYDYLPEKRRALDAWAILLREIVSGEKRAENVVEMKSA